MTALYDDWKTKIKNAAKLFLDPTRAVDDLLTSIIGIKIGTPEVLHRIRPIYDSFNWHFSICLESDIENEIVARKVSELLNMRLADAALELNAGYSFEIFAPKVNNKIWIVIGREHYKGNYTLPSLYDHLKEVKKYIDRTGRTLMEQALQGERLYPENLNPTDTNHFSIATRFRCNTILSL